MPHVPAEVLLPGDPLSVDAPRDQDLPPRGWLPESPVASALAVAGLYFVFAVIAILLSRRGSGIAMLWYANAMGVAVLQTRPVRQWAALLGAMAVGCVAAGRVFDDPLLFSLICTPTCLLEIALGGLLLRRYCVPAQCISHAAALLRALLLGGVLPALCGALLAAGALSAAGLGDFDRLSVAWFEGSSIGSVAVLPLGLLLAARGWRPNCAGRRSCSRWPVSRPSRCGRRRRCRIPTSTSRSCWCWWRRSGGSPALRWACCCARWPSAC
jgi:hypothetical protein